MFSSAPAVAMIVATLLDNTLDAKKTGSDRGLSWWIPFQRHGGEPRNDEFYGYPIRMHRWMFFNRYP